MSTIFHFTIYSTLCVGALAANKGDRLSSGGRLSADASDFHVSADSRFQVIMQQDCNLVLYKGPPVLWASGTNGKGSHCYAVMQGDGNFVVYTSNRPLWASNAEPHGGAYVVAQSDGNLVVYEGRFARWASGTNVPEPKSTSIQGHPMILRPGESLDGSRNDFLQATGTIITMRMQPDCNLVLYEGTAARWASNTNGNSNNRKVLTWPALSTDVNLPAQLEQRLCG
jgi:hypothetical protein